jgi:hypothetical protein
MGQNRSPPITNHSSLSIYDVPNRVEAATIISKVIAEAKPEELVAYPESSLIICVQKISAPSI